VLHHDHGNGRVPEQSKKLTALAVQSGPGLGDHPATVAQASRSLGISLAALKRVLPSDAARMAAAIIASVDQQPAPLRIMLGSQALQATVGVLKDRVASFEAQTGLAGSTDFPPGE
jgi:hypothetical protein